MTQPLNFWVIGGDLRQEKLAQLLREDGHSVHTFALEGATEQSLENIGKADCIVLPLPVTGGHGLLNCPMAAKKWALKDLFAALRPHQLLLGGMVDEPTQALANSHHLTILDYFHREELAVANAVPTAEGAIQIALEELPVTLHRAHALVIGYGRVGKLTAHRLAALGAQVTVAARKYADLAWAEAYGHTAVRLQDMEGYLCGYDLVVNTVPALVLTRPLLEDLKETCLVLDLASKPGGVDLEAAKDLSVRVIWALSLPGKVAPVTAGGAIRDTIYNILRERS